MGVLTEQMGKRRWLFAPSFVGNEFDGVMVCGVLGR